MTSGNLDDVIFSATLTPHRSLGRRGFLVLMVALGGLWFLTGLYFWSLGAWPVAGFFGLDFLAVWLAFKLNYRAARAFEEVEVTRSAIVIRRVAASGKAEELRFNPQWVRLEVQEDPDFGVSRIALRMREERTRSAPSSTRTIARALPALSAPPWRKLGARAARDVHVKQFHSVLALFGFPRASSTPNNARTAVLDSERGAEPTKLPSLARPAALARVRAGPGGGPSLAAAVCRHSIQDAQPSRLFRCGSRSRRRPGRRRDAAMVAAAGPRRCAAARGGPGRGRARPRRNGHLHDLPRTGGHHRRRGLLGRQHFGLRVALAAADTGEAVPCRTSP